MSTEGDLRKLGIDTHPGQATIDLFKSGAALQIEGVTQVEKPSGTGAATTGLKRTLSVIATEVDASGGGTGTETAIGTVPAGSVLLAVICEVTETFNGDTTQTIEVGLTGNTDKYIDTSDINPGSGTPQISNFGSTTADQNEPIYLGSDEAIVATWTNTASATEGKAVVRLIYIET